jgi:hypothetical protein
MYVVGGLIVGNLDDTQASIEANLAFAGSTSTGRHPAPTRIRTPMTRDFRDRGLIVDHDVSHYTGTTAVVRSEHVSADDIEFLAGAPSAG